MADSVASFSNNKRRRTESSSLMQSSSIDDLPDHLLVEILIRLRCKYSCRCKCVSKRWFSLISDPYFLRQFMWHRRFLRTKQPFTLMFQCTNLNRREFFFTSKQTIFKSPGFSLRFLLQDTDSIFVVGSSNDLLLCCAGFTYQSVYYICNPLTKQWVALPPVPHSHESVHVKFICDPFYKEDEKECTITMPIDFQYRYKVMLIPKFNGRQTSFNVEMFSSETGNWSQSVVSCPQGFSVLDFDTINAIAYNGMLWWKNIDCIAGYNPYYDNADQIWRIIDKPADWCRGMCSEILGVCRGCLRISQLAFPDKSENRDAPYLRVWELKDYNMGKWCLVHKVYLNQMKTKRPSIIELVNDFWFCAILLPFHPNNGDVIYMLRPNCVLLCNMRRGTLKLVSKLPDTKVATYFPHTFPLVLPWWPTPVPLLSQNAVPE